MRQTWEETAEECENYFDGDGGYATEEITPIHFIWENVPAAPDERPCRNIRETAEYLGCTQSRVRQLIRRGRIHSIRAGRNHQITEEALRAFFDSRRASTASD